MCRDRKKEHIRSVGDTGLALGPSKPQQVPVHLLCSAMQDAAGILNFWGGELGNEDLGIFPTTQLTPHISGTVSTANVNTSNCCFEVISVFLKPRLWLKRGAHKLLQHLAERKARLERGGRERRRREN